MKNNRFSFPAKERVASKLLLIVAVLSMIPVFFVSRTLFLGFAQTKDKKEKKFTKESYKNEPIEFIELKSNGKKFKLNEKLTREDDWLKGFTIDFKNISNKSITYVSIIINFPETRSNGLPMSYCIRFRRSASKQSNSITKRRRKPVNSATDFVTGQKLTAGNEQKSRVGRGTFSLSDNKRGN